jgi:hypothetical protein
MMKHFFLIAGVFLLTLPTASYAKISNTNELIAAMQKKYGKSWYKTATFVQETTNIQPDGSSKVETWYEAMSVPGSLRIDFTPKVPATAYCLPTAKSSYLKTARSILHAPLSIRSSFLDSTSIAHLPAR